MGPHRRPTTRLRLGGAVQPQILVVTDPPHDEVDLEAVAALLSLDVDDARLKLGYPAPEVLLASDPSPAVDFAGSLRSAGLRVAVVDGRALTRVPWPAPVGSFAFGDEGLVAQRGDEVVELRYDEPLFAVACRPPEGITPPDNAGAASPGNGASDGLRVAESLEWVPTLDLYVTRDGEVERLTIAEDRADFSGLGDVAGSSPGECMARTLDACQTRFRDLEVDRRLEHVRPRQRFVMGAPDFDYDLRKLYSFGTLLLRQVLDSISPELKDLTQYELGSRLAWVVSRQRES
jgi:hypothetical protein